MTFDELKMALAEGKKLCLGHACIAAYSCFEIATEALDEDGNGYCSAHAAYIREVMGTGSIYPKCIVIVWEEQTTGGKVGHWKCGNPDCKRCAGTGIDPICSNT